MVAYATVPELEARLAKTLTGAEIPRAESSLESASAKIRSVARPIDWLVNGVPTNVPDIIKTITLDAAQRSMNNPLGTTQASVGDVSVSYSGERSTSGDRGGAGGVVYLSASEREEVRRAANHPNAYSAALS